jgi:DNA-binding response OmpR family regulator
LDRACDDEGVALKVLVVEDDQRIRASLSLGLSDEGYQAIEAPSTEDALKAFEQSPADIALVDLMLPGADGFECCRRLRQLSDLPIIVITARTDTHDVVAGLEAGADDYVTKPFELKELVARMRAVLRRLRPTEPTSSVIEAGPIEVRPEAGVAYLRGNELRLTRTEFRLLGELAAHAGRVLSREVLLERVWEYGYFGDGRLVDVHVRRLRTKIEQDPANPSLLVTVRGMGYKLLTS